MGYKHFTKDERNELSILLRKGYSLRDIGRVLGKNPSSISREISRNNVKGVYDPDKARHKAWVARANSKYQGMKIHARPGLEQYVQEKLQSFWTPEEIAGRLALERGGQTVVSPKSIYKYLYSPYGQPFCRFLPSRRYQAKKRTGQKQKRVIIPNRIGIEQRPAVVEARSRLGDFEGDTLGRIKSDWSVLAGLLERRSRYLFLKKVSGLKYVMSGFRRLLAPCRETVASLTLDNGIENAGYQALNVPTYFCRPYHAWEKASLENAFQRLRRFIPKRAALKNYSHEDIMAITDIMNNTPRKCLNWRTPKEVFVEHLSATIKQPKCCT